MFKEQLFRDALRLYAGQHVLDRVEQLGRDALRLQSGPRHMTIMWIDIRGFAKVDLALPREKLWAAVNAHQQRVVDCMARYGGIVDNLIGDAVLACWGMQGPGNHAVLALNCAAELIQVTDPAETGIIAEIGLDTGTVGLGNFGTPERCKYTVMGDVVNLASRLSTRCSQYEVQVLLSEAVLAHAGDAARPARLVDTLRIKGKEGTTDIFTLANVRPGWPRPESG